LHVPYVSERNLKRIRDLGSPVSFFMPHLYFWGLPECQQILGRKVTQREYAPYPAATALKLGMHVTFHTDSPVTPPDPIFAIWVAATRKVQQPAWYPNLNPERCPAVNNPQEIVSIEDGLRAYTIEAAYQYGLQQERGSIKVGKHADFAILSEDPLSMEGRPNQLKTLRVLATVHDGTYRKNPLGDDLPIWPD
jgi:predicted amidohydrolase YtcJ